MVVPAVQQKLNLTGGRDAAYQWELYHARNTSVEVTRWEVGEEK